MGQCKGTQACIRGSAQLAIAGALLGVVGCGGGGSGGRGDDGGVGSGDSTAAGSSGASSNAADSSDDGHDDAPLPDMGVPVPPTCADDDPGAALELVGAGEGVHVGLVPALGLQQFTLEAWVRWDGYGTTASSGVGGVAVEPILSKGRGEDDGSTVDCNYVFGVDAEGHLAADFEDLASGLNHPVTGTAVLETGAWHHVAATFDGSSWRLYLDGELDATASTDGAMPRHDSIQHSGIGTTYDSMGRAAGSFDGRIDDARIWDRPLDAAALQAGMFAAPPDTSGLIAHWPLDAVDDGSVPELVGGFVGERTGGAWSRPGRPRLASGAPSASNLAPVETAPSDAVVLSVQTADADADELRVELWGRAIPELESFSIAVLPDTQYYCDGTHGGSAQMFYDQTQWLADSAESLDLRAVLHVGDLVDDGHTYVEEWMVAQNALERLEDALPDRPAGVAYGVAVGNHDQATNSYPGQTGFYNQYFGTTRFEGRDYYGGHFGDRNDASFITFGSGDTKFVALFFEYDQPGIPTDNTGPDGDVLAWARRVLADHPDHYGIVVQHSCLVGTGNGVTVDTPFSPQGQARWQALRGEPNLRLMVCGHVQDEGRRTDVAASTVHSLLSDYQFDGMGGSGKLRLMSFRADLGELEVQTYSPHFDQWYETDDAHFVLPIDLDHGGGEFELIGTVEHVQAGSTVDLPWSGLAAGGRYEWFARVTDCTHSVDGPRSEFTAE